MLGRLPVVVYTVSWSVPLDALKGTLQLFRCSSCSVWWLKSISLCTHLLTERTKSVKDFMFWYICQIGFAFACVHLAFYFHWRTQGRRNVLHLKPEDGRTRYQKTGLSFPWEFIPWVQPSLRKISVSWRGKHFSWRAPLYERSGSQLRFLGSPLAVKWEFWTWLKFCGKPG